MTNNQGEDKMLGENYVTTEDEFKSMVKEMHSFDSMRSPVPSLRKMRADRITHEIMSIVDKHIENDANRTARNICRDILDMFYKADVDIITESDRINAGLPRRNAYGLTDDEMCIWEHKKMETMLQPLPMISMSNPDQKTRCPKCGEVHKV